MNITDEQSEKWLNQVYTIKEEYVLHHFFFVNRRIQDMGKDKKERNRMITGMFLKINPNKLAKAYLWRIMVMNEIIKPS